jgi:uncharacterized membrane protein YfcA
MSNVKHVSNGPFLAALVSAGIGCSVLGLCTTLAEASEPISQALNFYPPVGSLTGKSTLAIVAWLVSWFILQTMWKDKNLDFQKIVKVAFFSIVVGIIGTFPPFFELF